MQEWGDTYDADPISLPVSPQLPVDLPLVILSSRDQSQRLEIARSRVNTSWSRQSGDALDLAATLAAFASRLGTLAEKLQVTVGRVGLVISRLAASQHPGQALAEQFCRERWLQGPLNRAEGFELHAHKVFPLLPDVSVNSWMRIKTVQVAAAGYNHVLVEQDINTLLPELDTRRFSTDQLVHWFREAGREADAVLRLYFPPH